MHLAMRANALVAFPGGFGTFDELFEVMTLRQTGKGHDIPIILFDESYWRDVVNFDRMLDEGVIGPSDMRVFEFADSARQAWDKIVEARRAQRRHGDPQGAPGAHGEPPPSRPEPRRGEGRLHLPSRPRLRSAEASRAGAHEPPPPPPRKGPVGAIGRR